MKNQPVSSQPTGKKLSGAVVLSIGPALPLVLLSAAQHLPGTGGDALVTEAAPWWVIIVALTVVVIGLGTRTKPDR